MVLAALGIEGRAATGTSAFTSKILTNGKLPRAGAAKHRFLVPLGARPHLSWVAGKCLVAILAGIVDAAALHPDGSDVVRCMPMETSRIAIDVDPGNVNARSHAYSAA